MANARILGLIPAYNPDSHELDVTVRSLLDDWPDLHALIVDDGSRQPVIFAHDRVTVLRMPANGGITPALRAGVDFAISQGYSYVCRIDVGDRNLPGRVERQLAYMEANRDVALVGGRSLVLDPDGAVIGDHGFAKMGSVRAYAYYNAPFKHSTFFLRVEALRAHGNYDPGFLLAQDYELTLRLLRRARVGYIDTTLIEYIDSPKGLSATRRARQLRFRLRAQLRHFDPASPHAFVGLARTLITMVVPTKLLKYVAGKWPGRSAEG